MIRVVVEEPKVYIAKQSAKEFSDRLKESNIDNKTFNIHGMFFVQTKHFVVMFSYIPPERTLALGIDIVIGNPILKNRCERRPKELRARKFNIVEDVLEYIKEIEK